MKNTNKYFKNFLKYRYALYFLVRRDFIVKYRRSLLGVFWSVLNPILMMIVITAVFSRLFRFDIEYYPVYYLTGYIMFSMFSNATTAAAASVINAFPLMNKLYIPKYIFPLEKCVFAMVNACFSIIALICIALFMKVPASPLWLLVPVPFILLFIFTSGAAMVIAALNVIFRDMGHLYSVMIVVAMYATPIFYPVSILSEKMAAIMEFNPLYRYIDYFRMIFIAGTLPDAADLAFCFIYAFLSFIIGLFVFKSLQNRFILYI